MYANWKLYLKNGALCGLFFMGVFLDCLIAYDNKKIQVFIIGIPTYNRALVDVYNPKVNQSILKTVEELEGFFHSYGENVEVTKLLTEEGTTDAELRAFFGPLGEFKRKATGTMSIIFIIAHGERIEDRYYVYCSNTDDPVRNGWDAGNDIMSAIGKLSQGSTVFIFLDTCYSGSISNLRIEFDDLINRKIMGVRSMLIASALPQQIAKDVTFTKALLRYWSIQREKCTSCTSPIVSSPAIRDLISQLAHLEPLQGIPEVVLPYNGYFCMETFQQGQVVMIITNRTAETLQYELYLDSTECSKPPVVNKLESGETAVIGLPFGSYVFKYSNGIDKKEERRYLSSEKRIMTKLFDNDKDLVGIAQFYEEASALARGLEESEYALRYGLAAQSAYNAASHSEDAMRIEVSISDLMMEYMTNPDVYNKWSDIGSSEVYELIADGDFAETARMFSRLGESLDDETQKDQYFQAAYLSWIASEKIDKAIKVNAIVRNHGGSICDDCQENLQFSNIAIKDLSSASLKELKVLSVEQILSYLSLID